MHRSLVALVAVVAVGCAKPAAEEPDGPRGSPKEAVKETRELIDEAYRVLRDGDPVSLMGLLAPDLFLVGPGPDEVGLDRSAAIELAGTVIDSRKKHKLRSLGLEIEGGPDGVTAWAIDQIEYDGHAFAVTVIAAQVDGLWFITAIELAHAIPTRKLEKLRSAPLPELPRWEPPEAKVSAHGAAPRSVLDAVKLAAADVGARLDQYGKQRDAAFVGPAPDQVEIGAKAIAKAWKKRAPSWQLDDTLVGSTPDGGLAWVVAHGAVLDDRAEPESAEPTVGPPRRLFVIYRNDGAGPDGWALSLWHESVALPR